MPLGQVPDGAVEDVQLASASIEETRPADDESALEDEAYTSAVGSDIFYIRKRLALLGAHYTGKSALANYCAHGTFNPKYIPTFEDVYIWRTLIDHIPYEVTILDTEGRDGRSLFGSHFTIGVDAYILVFSVCDPGSFEAVKTINRNLMRILGVTKTNGCQEVPRIIVGTKIDDLENRCVPYDVVAEYAAHLEVPYIETSAVGGFNVPEAFAEAIRIIVANWRRSHILSNDETLANLLSSYENNSSYNPRVRLPSQCTQATPTANSNVKSEHDQRESSSAPDTANQTHQVASALESVTPSVPFVAPSSEPKNTAVPSPLASGENKSPNRSNSCFVQ